LTALWYVSIEDQPPVVGLLVERGAEPTTVNWFSWTTLVVASRGGHLEVTHLLLGLASNRAVISNPDCYGETALVARLLRGLGGLARAQLEAEADPTLADNKGITRVAIAKRPAHDKPIAEDRRKCVAELEVKIHSKKSSLPQHVLFLIIRGVLAVAGMAGVRRPGGPTSCERPGKWPTSRGATRWRCRGGGRGVRRGRRWLTIWCTG
jgi:hypothetical protein